MEEDQIIFDISHILRKAVAIMLVLTDIIDLVVDHMDKEMLGEMVDDI